MYQLEAISALLSTLGFPQRCLEQLAGSKKSIRATKSLNWIEDAGLLSENMMLWQIRGFLSFVLEHPTLKILQIPENFL
jgi:hypothetical protein